MPQQMDFKRKVKSRLAELDMSQLELAEELGMDKDYLNQIIAGRRKAIKKREIIAQRLEIPTRYFQEVI